MVALIALEPGYAVVDDTLRELWKEFSGHMEVLKRTPDAAFLPDAEATVEKIQTLVRSVETQLEAQIADLDREVAAVVGRSAATHETHELDAWQGIAQKVREIFNLD